jgi:hypothetical protein
MAALEDLKKEKEKQKDSNSVSRHHVCNRQKLQIYNLLTPCIQDSKSNAALHEACMVSCFRTFLFI